MGYYITGELANGHVVGTKRKSQSFGVLGDYEIWDGKDWVDEGYYEMGLPKKCKGCNDPFCDCGGKPQFDLDGDPIARLKELVELQSEINEEIAFLVNHIGGGK